MQRCRVCLLPVPRPPRVLHPRATAHRWLRDVDLGGHAYTPVGLRWVPPPHDPLGLPGACQPVLAFGPLLAVPNNGAPSRHAHAPR